jgi:hypothetical protein
MCVAVIGIPRCVRTVSHGAPKPRGNTVIYRETSTHIVVAEVVDSEVSTDSAPPRAPRASACEPHRERIAAAVRLGRNAMAIWQDLVDDLGFTARYASVRSLTTISSSRGGNRSTPFRRLGSNQHRTDRLTSDSSPQCESPYRSSANRRPHTAVRKNG